MSQNVHFRRIVVRMDLLKKIYIVRTHKITQPSCSVEKLSHPANETVTSDYPSLKNYSPRRNCKFRRGQQYVKVPLPNLCSPRKVCHRNPLLPEASVLLPGGGVELHVAPRSQNNLRKSVDDQCRPQHHGDG